MRGVVVLGVLWLAACGPRDRPGGEDVDGGERDAGDPLSADAAPYPDVAPLPEICDDGLDNDGNGLVDDLCPCTLGDTQPCFPGAESARGVGACRDGEQECLGDVTGEFGDWGPCVGAVTPAAETCDVGTVDEDCSGTANDGCECVPGSTPVACGIATPPCVAGTRSCEPDGTLGDCLGAMGPWTEVCDGTDNDCNGTADEGCECTDGTTMP